MKEDLGSFLPRVNGAQVNSSAKEYEPSCLLGTRLTVLPFLPCSVPYKTYLTIRNLASPFFLKKPATSICGCVRKLTA